MTNICGIYEIQLRRASFDTGIDVDLIHQVISKFASNDKIYYINGWVAVRNFAKHQRENPKVAQGISLALQQIPQNIKDTLIIHYGYSIDSLSHSNSNSNSNNNSNSNTRKIDFENFWKEYPKKVGKGLAKRKWDSLSLDQQEKILEVLPKHSNQPNWKKDNGQFIPHPTTWLNQERWNDEVEVIKTSTKTYD